MENIDVSLFTYENAAAETVADGTRFTFEKRGGKLILPQFRAEAGKYLAMDLTNGLDASIGITWRFDAADGRFIAFKMGLLPHLRTRIALPFSVLDGKVLFLPRTPGKLKTVTQGRPLPIDAVERLTIDAGSNSDKLILTIHDIFVTDTEPDYPLPDVKMVDALGQKLCTDWKGKTHSVGELKSYLNGEFERVNASAITMETSERSRFGGWKRKRFDSRGFFTLQNDGRRWWLADPDGYAFFSMGLDCVSVDGDCNLTGIKKLCEELPPAGSVGWRTGRKGGEDFFSFHMSNLYKAFGDGWYDKWSRITSARMNEWGFNTIACWSDLRHARSVYQPYTYIFYGFPHTSESVFRDFPDVFAPEYAALSDKWARQISDFADDPYLLGYFMGNEPQWAFVNDLNLAALLLESGRELASFGRLIEFLKAKYSEIASLNAAWETGFDSFEAVGKCAYNKAATADLWEFTALMIREYMRVPSEAIRKYDKNHLNLGIRYAWLSSEVLASGSEFVDIFSFNCYHTDPTWAIDNFYAKVKKPVIIGEFHFGALDAGLDATGLRGVTCQRERGAAYRHYMQKAAAHPMCLGAHYFTLNDQAYLGRFDGENYQIGVIDLCQKPYADFVSGIVQANSELYEIADGKRAADAPAPAEIPATAF